MPFLQRQASKDRGAGTVDIRGYDFDTPTDDLRLFDFAVEVDSGGGSVRVELLGQLGWFVESAGMSNNEQLLIKRPVNALRFTWTGGSGGTVNVYASPKYSGAVP